MEATLAQDELIQRNSISDLREGLIRLCNEYVGILCSYPAQLKDSLASFSRERVLPCKNKIALKATLLLCLGSLALAACSNIDLRDSRLHPVTEKARIGMVVCNGEYEVIDFELGTTNIVFLKDVVAGEIIEIDVGDTIFCKSNDETSHVGFFRTTNTLYETSFNRTSR